MDACTIVWMRDLARARVLASMLAAHAPQARLTVLVLDGGTGPVNGIEGARLLGPEDVADVDEWGLIAATNPPGALAIALLPKLVRAVLERDGGGSVIYLGAGQLVLGPLDDLQRMTDDHQTVLVARARAAVGDDGSVFAGETGRGAFSHEAIGFREGSAATALLSAWPRRFEDREDGGASAVARWLDSIPAISQDVGVLRDAGYGLDPLTLGSRSLAERAGTLLVDGRRASLVDLSELDPDDPPGAFEAVGSARLSTKPALAALVARYAADLMTAGYARDARQPHGLDRLPDGARLTATMRGLALEAIADGALTRSPFSETGRAQLYGYLNAPGDRGRAAGLTRLHLAIWHASDALRAAYPHLSGPDGSGFAGWLCEYGESQAGLVAQLLPPAPDLSFRDAEVHIHRRELRWGVNVAGFFTSELGVGEAARLLIAGLDARDIPALPVQGNLAPPSRQQATHRHARPDEAAYPINIVCINGDGIPVFAREAGRSFFEGRHTVALWWWEVGDPPADWSAAYEFVDEVWVASEHIYEAIAPSSPVPVVRMTLPVLEPETAPVGRAELGLPEDGFLFLYVHDYHSVSARKNPDGLIAAFREAFAPGGGAKLVIKSINASSRPAEHERVALSAAGHPDIVLLDGYVSAQEKNAMIARCDCYVSLHRSEGFGLTVAEAMLLERPVIATRYGGTQEFLDDSNAYLVDYDPVRVGEGAFPYPAGGIWAQPSVAQAARLMRDVLEHPDQARERAGRARRTMLERHSPQVAGEAMERRLRFIYDRLGDDGADTLDLARLPSARDASQVGEDALEARIQRVPEIAWGAGWDARARFKLLRPLAEWARSHIEHQIFVEGELQREIIRLDERLREVARTLQEQQQDLHARTLAAVRKLGGG